MATLAFSLPPVGAQIEGAASDPERAFGRTEYSLLLRDDGSGEPLRSVWRRTEQSDATTLRPLYERFLIVALHAPPDGWRFAEGGGEDSLSLDALGERDTLASFARQTTTRADRADARFSWPGRLVFAVATLRAWWRANSEKESARLAFGDEMRGRWFFESEQAPPADRAAGGATESDQMDQQIILQAFQQVHQRRREQEQQWMEQQSQRQQTRITLPPQPDASSAAQRGHVAVPRSEPLASTSQAGGLPYVFLHTPGQPFTHTVLYDEQTRVSDLINSYVRARPDLALTSRHIIGVSTYPGGDGPPPHPPAPLVIFPPATLVASLVRQTGRDLFEVVFSGMQAPSPDRPAGRDAAAQGGRAADDDRQYLLLYTPGRHSADRVMYTDQTLVSDIVGAYVRAHPELAASNIAMADNLGVGSAFPPEMRVYTCVRLTGRAAFKLIVAGGRAPPAESIRT